MLRAGNVESGKGYKSENKNLLDTHHPKLTTCKHALCFLSFAYFVPLPVFPRVHSMEPEFQ